jgi:hypothetical protein
MMTMQGSLDQEAHEIHTMCLLKDFHLVEHPFGFTSLQAFFQRECPEIRSSHIEFEFLTTFFSHHFRECSFHLARSSTTLEKTDLQQAGLELIKEDGCY